MIAETNSPDGIAIFGNAPRGDQFSTGVGVFGRSAGDDGSAGVYGEATSSGSYGVHGVASAGVGVRGKNQASGNYGALGTSTAGVRGHAVGATDYAGHFTGGRNYFEGNVGIGIMSPGQALSVNGDAFIAGDIYLPTFNKIRFGQPEVSAQAQGLSLILESGQDIWLQPADRVFVGDPLMVQNSPERVGLGTTSPDEMLHVENSDVDGLAFLKLQTSHPTEWGETGLRFETPQNRWHLRMDDYDNGNIPEGALGLRCNTPGHEIMTWTEDGMVGIGNTNPSAKLDVVGDLELSGAYRGHIGPNNGAPFPRPAYDSGWVAISQGETRTLFHEIGGTTNDYVVDMQFDSPYLGLNNVHVGGYVTPAGSLRGAYWHSLTSSSIKISRYSNAWDCEQIRIRIWDVN